MKIAAADVSIAKSGLARIDGTLATITPGRIQGYARLRPMAATLIRDLRNADLVMLEGYDPHPRGYLALVRAAELGGMVRAALVELAIPWVDVPPSTLKRFACGKGNAPKLDVVMAARAAGANPGSDDEADAFWLRALGVVLANGLDGLVSIPDELQALADKVRPIIARSN